MGHRDTDNLIRENTVRGAERSACCSGTNARRISPNRNRIESNRVENSGGDDGVAIAVEGENREVQIRGNHLRESRGSSRRCGLRLAKEVGSIELADNHFEGFATNIDDLRARKQ